MRLASRILRSLSGWLTLLVAGLIALLLTIFTPGIERRRRISRATARVVLAAAGLRLRVRFEDPSIRRIEQALPERCVIVANHASFLDGPILAAVLPPRFSFVVKQEMRRAPLAGLLLRRIGAEFVHRKDRHRGAMDTRRIVRRAHKGEGLVFFPEGTFGRGPEPLKFRRGAFVTALRARCAIVPVVIHGAGRAMPPGRWLVEPGTIDIEVLRPIHPAPGANISQLRDEAWRRMSAHLASVPSREDGGERRDSQHGS